MQVLMSDAAHARVTAALPGDLDVLTLDAEGVVRRGDEVVTDHDPEVFWISGDLFAADNVPVDEDVATLVSLEGLGEAVERLGELERDVVRLRFGLDGEPPASLETTAKRLGIGVRRVRSVEASALRFLATQPEVGALHSAA